MNTKKTFLLASLAVASQVYSPCATAQTMIDAVRFSSTDIIGTARYRSMAGAFGALGGDPTCMNDNPAGLGVYRGTNLASITPHLGFTSTETSSDVKATSKDNNLSISNFSLVFSFMPEVNDYLVNFNLGLGINRRQQTFRNMNAVIDHPTGSMGEYLFEQANSYLDYYEMPADYLGTAEAWNDGNVPLLSVMGYESFAIRTDEDDPDYVTNPIFDKIYQQSNMCERTRNDHYNISMGANFNDVLYAGITFNIVDFNSMIEHCFTEDSERDMSGDFITYDNRVETKGSGFGINLGLLWKPTDQLRLGAAIHTPTWMDMKEYNDASMDAYNIMYRDACKYAEQFKEPLPQNWSDFNNRIEYSFSTPWEYQFSAAYIFGTQAILSFEYDLTDITTMKFSRKMYGSRADELYYDDMNKTQRQYVKAQHTFKTGIEYRLNPQFSLRAGYAYKSSPYDKKALFSDIKPSDISFVYRTATKLNYNTLDGQHYITAGAGWRSKSWNIDLSCVSHSIKEYYSPYTCDFTDSDIFNFNTHSLEWDLSFGYRF